MRTYIVAYLNVAGCAPSRELSERVSVVLFLTQADRHNNQTRTLAAQLYISPSFTLFLSLCLSFSQTGWLFFAIRHYAAVANTSTPPSLSHCHLISTYLIYDRLEVVQCRSSWTCENFSVLSHDSLSDLRQPVCVTLCLWKHCGKDFSGGCARRFSKT